MGRGDTQVFKGLKKVIIISMFTIFSSGKSSASSHGWQIYKGCFVPAGTRMLKSEVELFSLGNQQLTVKGFKVFH